MIAPMTTKMMSDRDVLVDPGQLIYVTHDWKDGSITVLAQVCHYVAAKSGDKSRSVGLEIVFDPAIQPPLPAPIEPYYCPGERFERRLLPPKAVTKISPAEMSARDPSLDVERAWPRYQRQAAIVRWARSAFGDAEATSLPQRGIRLLEEAIEAFQACGGDEAKAHELVTYVFKQPPGAIGQELGGVAVTTLLLAAAAGLSADEEECREIHRVLGKPIEEFTARNARKNAAGFLVAEPKLR